MTAIVGVMNKHAVAIAADSAVTINGTKVFNSANKLFALSKYQPIAVAIYSSSELCTVPCELLIKQYRAQLRERSFATVKEYAEDFLGFVGSNRCFLSKDAASNIFVGMCRKRVSEILSNIEQGNPDIDVGDSFRALFIEELKGSVIELSKSMKGQGVSSIEYADFCAYYEEEIKQIGQELFSQNLDISCWRR